MEIINFERDHENETLEEHFDRLRNIPNVAAAFTAYHRNDLISLIDEMQANIALIGTDVHIRPIDDRVDDIHDTVLISISLNYEHPASPFVMDEGVRMLVNRLNVLIGDFQVAMRLHHQNGLRMMPRN